jgi:hypothetical protein
LLPALLATLLVASALPAADPPVTISLFERSARAVPTRQGFTHTGAGNIDVAQPAPDTLVITMTGVTVAGGHPCQFSTAAFDFDLTQCFEIAASKPEVKTVKLTVEGRVIGLLRSHCKGGGSAEQGQACATVSGGAAALVSLCMPPHSVTAGENLSVNDHEGPVSLLVRPGKYTVHQVFHLGAAHPRAILPCKAASAEYAPDPALDPLWISYQEPFHGAQKKDFGFQVTLEVAPGDTPSDNNSRKEDSNKKEETSGTTRPLW